MNYRKEVTANPFHLKMVGFEVPFHGRFYPTRNDARYPSEVIVHYPLHPLFGRGKLPVCRRRSVENVEHVEVQFTDVRQAVPVWTIDEQLCGHLTIGFEPSCSLTALLELLSLLHSAEL